MSDALLSPAVGGIFWVVSAGLLTVSAKKIKDDGDESKIPFMGVMSAFVFAAQMINFSIPGTGSSGHLGGGLLLAILLGPARALVAMASILLIQCLLFADGGLMALGANIFNLGFIPAFLAFPLIWKPVAGDGRSRTRVSAATLPAAVAGLAAGAMMVVLQTVLSGISELPFGTFTMFMLPVHLGIGIVEGLVTMGIVLFVRNMRPDVLQASPGGSALTSRKLIISLLASAVLVGGLLSWFASSKPDGLEWSIARTSGQEELELEHKGIKGFMAKIVEKAALLPDYGFKSQEEGGPTPAAEKAGTSFSGLIGLVIVMVVAVVFGLVFRRRSANHGGKGETGV